MGSCQTYIRIDFPVDKPLDSCEFCDMIFKWRGDSGWLLADIIKNCDVNTDDIDDTEGHIVSLDFTAFSAFIEINDSDKPCVKLWRRIVNKHYPHANLSYRAHDPINGIAVTNEVALYDLYRVETDNAIEDCVEDADVRTRIAVCLHDFNYVHRPNEQISDLICAVNQLVPNMRIDKWVICLASEWG